MRLIGLHGGEEKKIKRSEDQKKVSVGLHNTPFLIF